MLLALLLHDAQNAHRWHHSDLRGALGALTGSSRQLRGALLPCTHDTSRCARRNWSNNRCQHLMMRD